MDQHFQVEVIERTPNPQQVIYAAMHQEIDLTNSDKKLIVDDLCFDWANQHRWHINNLGYVARCIYHADSKKSSSILIHQELALAGFLGCRPNQRVMVDHVNGIRTDNRLSNLRFATKSQNMANRGKTKVNTSGFKGVRFHKPSGKWQAYIKFDYRQKSLGLFACKIDAAKAYDDAALRFFGKYAKLNLQEIS